jgi:glutamate 5-kinase
MVTKIEAARIATAAGIPVRLTSAARAIEAVEGKAVGTLFAPTGKRRATRLLWLAHASETRGRLVLDAGARRALVERGASLLAAGIVAVEGEFSGGDPVDVIGPDGALVARGLVNYDSAELPEMLGRSTSDLAASMGADHERAVIHRDDLILMA